MRSINNNLYSALAAEANAHVRRTILFNSNNLTGEGSPFPLPNKEISVDEMCGLYQRQQLIAESIHHMRSLIFNELEKTDHEKRPFHSSQMIAKQARKFSIGNCAEAASVALHFISQLGVLARIESYQVEGGDHRFLVFGRGISKDHDYEKWGTRTLIVDPHYKKTFLPDEIPHKLSFPKRDYRDPLFRDVVHFNNDDHSLESLGGFILSPHDLEEAALLDLPLRRFIVEDSEGVSFKETLDALWEEETLPLRLEKAKALLMKLDLIHRDLQAPHFFKLRHQNIKDQLTHLIHVLETPYSSNDFLELSESWKSDPLTLRILSLLRDFEKEPSIEKAKVIQAVCKTTHGSIVFSTLLNTLKHQLSVFVQKESSQDPPVSCS